DGGARRAEDMAAPTVVGQVTGRVPAVGGCARTTPRQRSLTAALLRNLPLQQGADLRLAVAPVSAQGTDRAELARLCPPGHGLRVNAEHGCDFCGGQQGLWFLRTRRHRYSSTVAGSPAGVGEAAHLRADGRGRRPRARLYDPSSPRCPTWSERLIVIGCMGDEFPI